MVLDLHSAGKGSSSVTVGRNTFTATGWELPKGARKRVSREQLQFTTSFDTGNVKVRMVSGAWVGDGVCVGSLVLFVV